MIYIIRSIQLTDPPDAGKQLKNQNKMKTFKKIILFGAGEPTLPLTFNVVGSNADISHFIDEISTSHANFAETPDADEAPTTYDATGIAEAETIISTCDVNEFRILNR